MPAPWRVASRWAKTLVEEKAGLIRPVLNAIWTIGRHLRRVYADGGDKWSRHPWRQRLLGRRPAREALRALCKDLEVYAQIYA